MSAKYLPIRIKVGAIENAVIGQISTTACSVRCPQSIFNEISDPSAEDSRRYSYSDFSRILLPVAEDVNLPMNLCQNILHHTCALNPGETLVQSLVFVGEPLVIDTELMQNSGIQIVDMDRILHDIV